MLVQVTRPTTGNGYVTTVSRLTCSLACLLVVRYSVCLLCSQATYSSLWPLRLNLLVCLAHSLHATLATLRYRRGLAWLGEARQPHRSHHHTWWQASLVCSSPSFYRFFLLSTPCLLAWLVLAWLGSACIHPWLCRHMHAVCCVLSLAVCVIGCMSHNALSGVCACFFIPCTVTPTVSRTSIQIHISSIHPSDSARQQLHIQS